MQNRLFSLTFLLLTLVPSAVRADEFDWPGHGTITFDVPAGWSLDGQQDGDAAYYFQATPKSQTAVVLQITLADNPQDQPVRADKLRHRLEGLVRPYMDDSVEKIFAPQALKLHHGCGWFVQFTDPDLVDKPPTPNNYKIMRNALLALDEHAVVTVIMQFNDPNGTEAADMLALVSSIDFDRTAATGSLGLTQVGENYEFTVPQSRLILRVPPNGLSQSAMRMDGGPANPRYFELARSSPNLIVSGWFELDKKFEGIKSLWKNETKIWDKKGLPAPVNVVFLKRGKWDIVAYDLPVSHGSNTHLRAEYSRAGTWIDLHLSITSDQPTTKAREEMLAVLQSLQVEKK